MAVWKHQAHEAGQGAEPISDQGTQLLARETETRPVPIIYEPRGEALKYSDLAVNLFTGCCLCR